VNAEARHREFSGQGAGSSLIRVLLATVRGERTGSSQDKQGAEPTRYGDSSRSPQSIVHVILGNKISNSESRKKFGGQLAEEKFSIRGDPLRRSPAPRLP
jgi:hypothetical protein